MKRKILLWPLLSILLVGCNGSDSPFSNDEYVPIGLTPSQQIIRAMNGEEAELLNESVEETDIFLNSLSIISESRTYAKKALPNHITASTFDQRVSIKVDSKRYENDVMVITQDTLLQKLYTGTLINSSTQAAFYAAVSEDETEITTTADITNDSGNHVVTTNTTAYIEATDYEDYFVFDLGGQVWDNIFDGFIGITEDGSIAALVVETYASDLAGAVTMDDGSRYIVETNSIFEAYLKKGLLDDEVTEYYYVSYARSYVEILIISEAIPNIVTEPITYLKKPILLSYDELVINASTSTNGNFVTSQIPESMI